MLRKLYLSSFSSYRITNTFISLSIFTSFILMLFHFKYIFIKHSAKERRNGSCFLWNMPLLLVIVTRIYICFLSCSSQHWCRCYNSYRTNASIAERTDFSKTKQSLNVKAIFQTPFFLTLHSELTYF